MWEIEHITNDSYVTITNSDVAEHFFISGEHPDNVKNIAVAVREAMNSNKKQPELNINIRLNEELLLLQNRVRVGTSGPVKKITGYQYFEGENQDRKSLMDKLISFCS